MSKHTLENKVIVIAGGGKNLGGLIARDLADRGVAGITVHYHSDSSKSESEGTIADLEKKGVKSCLVQADLSKPDQCKRLFAETTNKLGVADIAINTAGMVMKKPFAESSEEEFDKMFDVNAKAAYFFMREAAANMNDNGKICTIVTSLLAAYTGLYSLYAGAKAPVEHFTRAASKEFGPRGISVTAVAPGPMDTPFFYPAESDEAVAYHKSASALGGLTNIEDIVPLVRFLVTEGWWITGQTIFANGGYTTR